MNRASQKLKSLTERHNRQRDVKIRAFGREIDGWTARMEERLLGIVAANRGGMTGVLGSVDVYLIGELAGAAEIMQRGLMSIATWAWQSATANWVHALPLSFWLRRNLPVKTLVGTESLNSTSEMCRRSVGEVLDLGDNVSEGRRLAREMLTAGRDLLQVQRTILEYAGDLDAENQLQRILDGQVSREEAMEIIRQVEFGRPRIEEFEAIVNDVAWPDGLDAITRIKTVMPAELEKLRSVIRRYLTEVDTGAAWQSMTAEIKPLVGNVNFKAKRIARTEATRVAEDMQRKAFADAEDLIQGIRTFTAGDTNVRPTHRHWNGSGQGKLFHKTSGGYIARDGEHLPRFPAGPNCRCWTTPELIDDLTVGLPAEDLGAGYQAGLDRFKRQQVGLPTPKAKKRQQSTEKKALTAIDKAKAYAEKEGVFIDPKDDKTAADMEAMLRAMHPNARKELQAVGNLNTIKRWGKKAGVKATDSMIMQDKASGRMVIRSVPWKELDITQFVATTVPTSGGRVIVLNDTYDTSVKAAKQLKKLQKGWTVAEDLRGVLYHESAHVEASVLREAWPTWQTGRRHSEAAYTCMDIWEQHWKKQKRAKIASQLSDYAAVSADECWAEMRAKERLGGKRPRWAQNAIDRMEIDKLSWDALQAHDPWEK